MTNPLSSYGYSDEDYETAIGMMVGESSNYSTGQTLLHEMAGQLDVALNRLGSRQTGGRNFGKGRGLSLQDVILSPSQFDAATKTKGRAHKEQYSPAKRAALNDEYLATLTPAMQARVLGAREMALKVAGTKELRGITKNATTTSSTAYNLSGKRAREHNKEGRKTATKIGGTSFYGQGHDRKRSQEQAAAISTRLDQRASTSAPRADTPKERNLSGMAASRTPDYSQFGPLGTPREAIPPEARAPYSPSGLNVGPDFSSPPSQARGPVENPYGFSNIDTAREAVPGTFAGYGPNAFGALDQAPTDYGRTYPEISAGLYPDIAPPDVPAVPDIMGQFDLPNMMTEQQAIENAGLEGQRLSENVERRPAEFGRSIDEQVKDRWVGEETNDYLSALYGGMLGPAGLGMNVGINPAAPAFTTNPYENLAPPAVYGPDVPRTYPEISAGMYPQEAVMLDSIRNAPLGDIAPPDVPPVPDAMGSFPFEREGFGQSMRGQRPSENVEVRSYPDYSGFTEEIDARISELKGLPNPTQEDLAVIDMLEGVRQGMVTDIKQENSSAYARRGAAWESALRTPIRDELPVDYGKTYPNISAGMYPGQVEAARTASNALRADTSLAALGGPGYFAGTGAQLGTPDFAAASALDRDRAYQAEVAAMRDPAATAARGAWSDQAEVGPRSVDPTPFQGGLYGDPAMPAGGFTPGLDFSQPLGPSPDRFSGGPAEAAFNARMSEALQPGPAPPAELSPFQNTPLGLGQGIIDQGPYSSPIGYADKNNSFSPANLGNPMPNSTAVATQAPTTAGPGPQITGYENKTITRDVPNPAWSEWSKDYATANASQNAWAAADEDKRAWDRAPPNPSVLADTQWAGFGKEPAKTTQVATVVPDLNKPIYSSPVAAAPAVSVPAVNVPASMPAVNARPAQATLTAAPAAAPVGVGGWWDSITSGLGNALSGMSLANLGGDYAGYGAFGGAYDPGGYGGGGYGGTAPGDAGYGSDARSGAGNMGAGNLYQ